MWANKVSAVSNLVCLLSRLLPNLGNGGKTFYTAKSCWPFMKPSPNSEYEWRNWHLCRYFHSDDGEVTSTFTFSMKINSQIYWCNTFNDIFYTTILAGKKINIVPNFTKTFLRFNVYGRISLPFMFWFYF